MKAPWQWVQPIGTDQILRRLDTCRFENVHERERENMCSVAHGEITRLLAELTRYQRAHKSTCPGCELCIPGSDYMRNRAQPDLDLNSAGAPLRPGS